MISVRLPDGSKREFSKPVTVAEVASSIGSGLAKAALAGKVDDKLVDTSYIIEQGCRSVDHYRSGFRWGRYFASLDGPFAGLCSQTVVPGCPGDDRAGH